MTQLPIPGARMDKRTPADHLGYVRARLQCCIDMIDSSAGLSLVEQRATCWMVADELIACVRRLWEGCK